MHIILILGLLISYNSVFALDNPEQKLEQLLKNVTNLTGTFVQKVYDSNNRLLQENYGSMAIKRPNLINWQINKPERSLVVADGKNLWNYDQELDQVTVHKFSKENDLAPVTMLSGDIKNLKNEYEVENMEVIGGKCLQDSKQCFKLTPINNESGFQVIELGFINNVIHELQLQDALGQVSIVIFKNIKVNSRLEDSLFKFVPPAGVDVIRGVSQN
jgi:outer membrane lipoprotein carrier protein